MRFGDIDNNGEPQSTSIAEVEIGSKEAVKDPLPKFFIDPWAVILHDDGNLFLGEGQHDSQFAALAQTVAKCVVL
jgi:hypothetical protein